jgi:hypothetical protein
MGITLITIKTLRITYRMEMRDGRGNFNDKWLWPRLLPRFEIQTSLEFYVGGEVDR